MSLPLNKSTFKWVHFQTSPPSNKSTFKWVHLWMSPPLNESTFKQVHLQMSLAWDRSGIANCLVWNILIPWRFMQHLNYRVCCHLGGTQCPRSHLGKQRQWFGWLTKVEVANMSKQLCFLLLSYSSKHVTITSGTCIALVLFHTIGAAHLLQ